MSNKSLSNDSTNKEIKCFTMRDEYLLYCWVLIFSPKMPHKRGKK